MNQRKGHALKWHVLLVFGMKRLYWFGALCVLALRVSTDATGLACWVAARWMGANHAMHCLGVAVVECTLYPLPDPLHFEIMQLSKMFPKMFNQFSQRCPGGANLPR